MAGTQSITFSVDTTSPTLTITTPSGPKVSNSSLVVTLTYDEAVTGLTTNTAQFSEAINIASLTLLSASNDGRTYTVRITPQAEGLVKLTHAPGSPPVKDLAGNSIASTVSCSFTYDTTRPTVTLIDTDDDNLLAASDTVTITAFFNDAMTATPTISISGTSISGQRMTKISGGASGTGSATQLGGLIIGDAINDNLGEGISISSDGSIVAIGASFKNANGTDSGQVGVYKYNSATSSWTQLGADINGLRAGDHSGSSVSLSSDGSRLAIGSYGNDGISGNSSNMGTVRIYDYNGSAWVQVGAYIDGEARGDQSGLSVSLSSNGTRVAIGAPVNSGGGNLAGQVRIYDYNGSAWVKVGQDIDGKAANDRSGSSVSLSSDGLRVAIGAQGTINFSKKGYISIYQYNSGSSSWVQLGSDISGDSANDQFGHSISLSSDGLRVASGGYFRSDAIAGYARVYQYNTGTSSWTQLGSDLVGEANGDRFSQNLSLSSDGSVSYTHLTLPTIYSV